MGNIYGYVRVSTAEQNADRQVMAMRDKGIPEKNIVVEKASGKDFNRPMYSSLQSRLKPGDTLYIHSLDRLGRNYVEVPEEWNRLTRKEGVTIKVLDMELLDTDRPLSRIEAFIRHIVLMLMSFLAEDERLRIHTRQAEGINAAKARGVKFGRPRKPLPPHFAEVCSLWCDGQISGVEGARRCGMPTSTFYRKAHIWRDAEGNHRQPKKKSAASRQPDTAQAPQNPAPAAPATPDTMPRPLPENTPLPDSHSLPVNSPLPRRASSPHDDPAPSSQKFPLAYENVLQPSDGNCCSMPPQTPISRLTSHKVHLLAEEKSPQ